MTWTYPEVGVTRTGLPGPVGFRWLRVRHRLGPGDGRDLSELGEALLTWRVHAAAGVPLRTSAPRAAAGVDAETRLGVGPVRLRTPCRVVWVEATGDRVAFAYGTLPGHPFRGEEAFVIERDGAGDLWFAAQSVSRPAWRVLRPAGPLVRIPQRLYLRLLARGARRLLRAAQADHLPDNDRR